MGRKNLKGYGLKKRPMTIERGKVFVRRKGGGEKSEQSQTTPNPIKTGKKDIEKVLLKGGKKL